MKIQEDVRTDLLFLEEDKLITRGQFQNVTISFNVT